MEDRAVRHSLLSLRRVFSLNPTAITPPDFYQLGLGLAFRGFLCSRAIRNTITIKLTIFLNNRNVLDSTQIHRLIQVSFPQVQRIFEDS
jgi:hypothetical protein